MLQIRAADRVRVMAALRAAGLGEHAHVIGQLNARDEVRITRNNRAVFTAKRDHLQRTWSETSWRMQTLRDNPDCAREEYDRIIEPNDPGLSVSLTFKLKIFALGFNRGAPARRHPARAGSERPGRDGRGVRPRRVRVGRRAHDRPHRRRASASTGFKGVIAGGGFSYGDVLGGGQGWAKTILFNARARDRVRALLRAQATPSRSAPATAAR